MNFAHIHVVLNHIPSIGTAVGVILYILSMYQKNDGLKKLSLQIFVLMGMATLPTYMTGNASQLILRKRTEIPQGLIELHQNAAITALILMTILGAFSWFGLWQFRRFTRPGNGNTYAVLIFSILTSTAILRTANLGGDISHPEIRVGAVTATPEMGWREPIEVFTNEHAWVWPANETMHFIGMSLLFGVTLLLILRMLGMMKSIPFPALHRLLPLGILGFIMNVFSGMWFFIASPGMYVNSVGFAAKVIFILLAGLCVLYFTLFEEPWTVGPDKDAPLRTKIIAACFMVSLLGVMYFGRMLPFLRH